MKSPPPGQKGSAHAPASDLKRSPNEFKGPKPPQRSSDGRPGLFRRHSSLKVCSVADCPAARVKANYCVKVRRYLLHCDALRFIR